MMLDDFRKVVATPERRPSSIIVLTAGRSFSTVFSAMMGVHPQVYALPETSLFARSVVADYLRDIDVGVFDHGLVRALSQLCFDDQLDSSAASVRAWLEANKDLETLTLFASIERAVFPRRLLEKTPSLSASPENMRRADRGLGDGTTYVHITRHPGSYGLSLLETLSDFTANVPRHFVEKTIANEESLFAGVRDPTDGRLDPQRTWLRRNENIDTFLLGLPPGRYVRVRGEDVVNEPHATLAAVCARLGVACDSATIRALCEPQGWVYAKPGPPSASRGGDRKFQRSPELRPDARSPARLEDPLPWDDARGFTSAVVDLAREYGYR